MKKYSVLTACFIVGVYYCHAAEQDILTRRRELQLQLLQKGAATPEDKAWAALHKAVQSAKKLVKPQQTVASHVKIITMVYDGLLNGVEDPKEIATDLLEAVLRKTDVLINPPITATAITATNTEPDSETF